MLFYIVQADGTRVPFEGGGLLDNVETISDDTTLTIEQSGKVFLVDTDAKTITLPEGVKGVEYTFINVGADGAVKLNISPNAADGMIGTIANAAADSVASGIADKDWANTKGTANRGDWCKLMSDGGGVWYVQGGVGIWLSE